jgi:hypothetical protein
VNARLDAQMRKLRSDDVARHLALIVQDDGQSSTTAPSSPEVFTSSRAEQLT